MDPHLASALLKLLQETSSPRQPRWKLRLLTIFLHSSKAGMWPRQVAQWILATPSSQIRRSSPPSWMVYPLCQWRTGKLWSSLSPLGSCKRL
jgi:hypothetical protein